MKNKQIKLSGLTEFLETWLPNKKNEIIMNNFTEKQEIIWSN